VTRQAFVRELGRLVAAGYPIVLVVTHEEERALDAVREVWPEQELRVWAVTTGAHPVEAVTEAAGQGVMPRQDAGPRFRPRGAGFRF